MKAASLLEVLIVMAIFSMLVVLTFPFSLRLVNQSKADAEAKTLAYVLFRQQQDAYAGLEGKAYGVALYNDRFVVYTGTSLATAESSEAYYFASPIHLQGLSLSSGNEVTFSSNSFRPNTFGHFLISDSNKSYRIDINSEGLISYYGQ
ncbi:MAG: type II secretion system protein [Patescibacteria group bacterium]